MQFFKDRHYLDKEWGEYIGDVVGMPSLLLTNHKLLFFGLYDPNIY